MPRKLDRNTIRQMLDDVQFVATSRYTESPDPIGGCFYVPDGSARSIPFADLTGNDQADLLQTYVRWEDYKAKGVNTAQVLGIWQNVQAGKPRDQWLQGTGLDGGPNLTLEQLKALGQELAHDAALAKAEGEQRRRVEKFGSFEHDAPKLPEKDRDMER